jgi:hypothetical protein
MTEDEARNALADWLIDCRDDPLKFVTEGFGWGEPGSGLENETGPDQWQVEQLSRIRDILKADPINGRVRELTLSGHGIGKSAEVSWLTLWNEMTFIDAKAIITANTDTQLRTKTWAEVSKWFHMLHPLLQAQWELTATALYSRSTTRDKTWRADAIPNSKTNPAAFAGAHNAGKQLLLILDEGSEIDEVIYETMEGATTDANTRIIFMVYGNPTSPVGAFKERAEGRFRHMWQVNRVDSRSVKRTDKAVLQTLIDTYGEDSDVVRVRIKGQFPRVGAVQLIASDVVAHARRRPALYIPSDPLILGVDVARYGDDESVLAPRRGLDARTIPWRRYRGVSTMELVTAIMQFHKEVGFDAIMVDTGGVGAGVYDRLSQLNLRNLWPVEFGSRAADNGIIDYNGTQIRVANKRAEIWCKLRMSLYAGLAIPDEGVIETDLTGVQYGYDGKDAIQLEKKEHMKERGLASPDNGDALACTYAFHVEPRPWSIPDLPGSGSQGPRDAVGADDYDMFADLR